MPSNDSAMLESEVYCVPMSSPGDVSQVEALFDGGHVEPKNVVAIMEQTEGDPYCRGYATLAMQNLLSGHLEISHQEVFDRIPMLMIGGVGGIMCPHINLFVKKPATMAASGEERLSIGVASSRVLAPEEFGTMTQVDLVAETTKQAMADAGITSADEIHCVEIKCPAMTPARIADAVGRGKTVVNGNPAAASSMAKGACALGVAVATGEVDRSTLSDGSINVEKQHFSTVASTSAGGEQVACRAVVIGNVAGSPSRFVAAHGMMKDQLDIAGARKAFANAGLEMADGVLTEESRGQLAACFVNAGGDFAPDVRGRRHTMHSDFLFSFGGIQAKTVVHGIVSSIVGDTLLLASAGAEHQGPPGANLICVIADAAAK